MFFGLTKAISEPSMLSSNDFPTEHPLNDSFCDLNLPGQKVLWKVNPKPKDHHRVIIVVIVVKLLVIVLVIGFCYSNSYNISYSYRNSYSYSYRNSYGYS